MDIGRLLIISGEYSATTKLVRSMKTWIIILETIMMLTSCNCKGQKTEPTVRFATQANRFYTGDARELSEEVDSLLARHNGDKQYADLAAVIVPHAGYYFSGDVAAAAYMSISTDNKT